MEKILVKVIRGDVAYRIWVEQPATYSTLRAAILSTGDDVRITYKDDEGDRCVLTEATFEDCMLLAVQGKRFQLWADQPAKKCGKGGRQGAWAQAHEIHPNITCDQCNASPLTGPRYKSDVLHDFDLCGACYETHAAEHGGKDSFTRVPGRQQPECRPCGPGAWGHWGHLAHMAKHLLPHGAKMMYDMGYQAGVAASKEKAEEKAEPEMQEPEGPPPPRCGKGWGKGWKGKGKGKCGAWGPGCNWGQMAQAFMTQMAAAQEQQKQEQPKQPEQPEQPEQPSAPEPPEDAELQAAIQESLAEWSDLQGLYEETKEEAKTAASAAPTETSAGSEAAPQYVPFESPEAAAEAERSENLEQKVGQAIQAVMGGSQGEDVGQKVGAAVQAFTQAMQNGKGGGKGGVGQMMQMFAQQMAMQQQMAQQQMAQQQAAQQQANVAPQTDADEDPEIQAAIARSLSD